MVINRESIPRRGGAVSERWGSSLASGSPLHHRDWFSRSPANPADYETATLSDLADAPTPHAEWLGDRGTAVVVDRKALSEIHF